jgi:hypothetical protein
MSLIVFGAFGHSEHTTKISSIINLALLNNLLLLYTHKSLFTSLIVFGAFDHSEYPIALLQSKMVPVIAQFVF